MRVLNFLFKLLAASLMVVVGLVGVASIALGVNTTELIPGLIFWLGGVCFLLPACVGIRAVILSPPVFRSSKE